MKTRTRSCFGAIWAWKVQNSVKMFINYIRRQNREPSVTALTYISFAASGLSTEVNQTLHDVWPSPLVHYIYIFGGSCPLTEFCQVQNSLYVQVSHSPSPTLTALLHGTSAVGISHDSAVWGKKGNYVTFTPRLRYLYSTG